MKFMVGFSWYKEYRDIEWDAKMSIEYEWTAAMDDVYAVRD